jgi:hypothetical protein
MALSSSSPSTPTSALDSFSENIVPELIDLMAKLPRLSSPPRCDEFETSLKNTTEIQCCNSTPFELRPRCNQGNPIVFDTQSEYEWGDPITSSDTQSECEWGEPVTSSDTQSDCDWDNSILSSKKEPTSLNSDVQRSDSDSSTPTIRRNDTLLSPQLRRTVPIRAHNRCLSSNKGQHCPGSNHGDHDPRANHTKFRRPVNNTNGVSSLPIKCN